jgi:hypothetical protein
MIQIQIEGSGFFDLIMLNLKDIHLNKFGSLFLHSVSPGFYFLHLSLEK